MSTEGESLVSINEGARILEVSRRTIYTYVKENKLSLVKKKNRSFLKRDEISQFKESRISTERRKKPGPPRQVSFDPDKYVLIEKKHYEGLLIRLAQLATEAGNLTEKKIFLLEDLRRKKEGVLDRILGFFIK
ncbi:MAG: helix-turn-helix domain-containing protein [Deltaproteobacteria bacterium]|nr:helix-turn-helix domain-containing protein [Deltaproteobacteria bacterium]MBW2085630.1 helix-turn-helix domain-containing protein [Deltaproteobacteria bacterium]